MLRSKGLGIKEAQNVERIKVGGVTYAIERKESVEINQDKNYYGVCNFKDTLIQISNTVNEQRQQQTLIHEIMHAVFHEAGIELDNEETVVNQASLVWYQVLKDNDFSFLNK